MLGLIRLLTNRHVMKGAPLTTDEGWLAYCIFRDLPEVIWLSEPDSAESKMREWSDSALFPASRLTDAWIAAVAFSSRSRVVSFDADYRGFTGLSFFHLS